MDRQLKQSILDCCSALIIGPHEPTVHRRIGLSRNDATDIQIRTSTIKGASEEGHRLS